jgi:hypothetical protein
MPNTSSLEITDPSVIEKLRIAKRYVTSYYQSRKHHTLLQNIKTYCMFIGHTKSGGSLLGSLLDAHPDIILADEVNVLRYISAGFSRDQIYYLILAKSQKQARKGRRYSFGKVYSYLVPGQWQGRFDRLQVIGDSKAGESTQRLAQNPALLHDLQNIVVGANVKIIHIIRNPYDVISTMILRGGRTFGDATQRYFSNCEAIVDIRRRVSNSDMFVVKHEQLIAHPVTRLNEICCFLGVEVIDDYLNACASVLYKSPDKIRYSVQWKPELIDVVKNKINKFDL